MKLKDLDLTEKSREERLQLIIKDIKSAKGKLLRLRDIKKKYSLPEGFSSSIIENYVKLKQLKDKVYSIRLGQEVYFSSLPIPEKITLKFIQENVIGGFHNVPISVLLRLYMEEHPTEFYTVKELSTRIQGRCGISIGRYAGGTIGGPHIKYNGTCYFGARQSIQNLAAHLKAKGRIFTVSYENRKP